MSEEKTPRLSREQARELLSDYSRRDFLKATGSLVAVAGIASGSLGPEDGNLYGGTMALQKEFKVSERVWIGPDSAKSNVDPNEGRKYEAVDVKIEYYGDGSQWVAYGGVGSPSKNAPASYRDAVNAGELLTNFVEDNRWSSDKRPLHTSETTDLYVDPANGSDDNDGSQSTPIASLSEAFDRIPQVHYHPFYINLEPGTYNGPEADMPPVVLACKGRNPPFQIKSTTGTRSDVVINTEVSLAIWHGEQDAPTLKDVTIDHTVHQKFGNSLIQNVHFRGNGTPLTSSNGPVGFDVHAPCYLEFEQCEWSNAYTDGIRALDGATIVLTNCSGHPNGWGVFHHDHATVEVGSNNDNFWGERGQLGSPYPASAVDAADDGRRILDSPRLYDDFADNKEGDNRVRPNAMAGYRPVWDPTSDYSVVGDAMRLANGDRAWTEHTVMEGSYRWTFQFQSTPSTGHLQLRPLSWSSDDLIKCRVDSNGDLKVVIFDDLSTTTTISGTWTPDTAEHTLKLVRTDTGHELFFDGASIGTDVNPFVPDFSSIRGDIRIRQENDCDATVDIKEIEITQSLSGF